jgi:uncharacterized protein YwgA
MKITSKEQLTLLALGLADGKPLSPVQLQKAVFLLQERLTDDTLSRTARYAFVPHNYGPFCSAVYDDARELSERGFATISASDKGNFQEYAASERAVERAKSIAEKMQPETVALAQDIVDWVRAQSFRDLVSAIYKEYPHFRVNSIFNG